MPRSNLSDDISRLRDRIGAASGCVDGFDRVIRSQFFQVGVEFDPVRPHHRETRVDRRLSDLRIATGMSEVPWLPGSCTTRSPTPAFSPHGHCEPPARKDGSHDQRLKGIGSYPGSSRLPGCFYVQLPDAIDAAACPARPCR